MCWIPNPKKNIIHLRIFEKLMIHNVPLEFIPGVIDQLVIGCIFKALLETSWVQTLNIPCTSVGTMWLHLEI